LVTLESKGRPVREDSPVFPVCPVPMDRQDRRETEECWATRDRRV